MNAMAFRQSFLEVSVVSILACSEVDPCWGVLARWWCLVCSGEVENIPSTPLWKPAAVINICNNANIQFPASW